MEGRLKLRFPSPDIFYIVLQVPREECNQVPRQECRQVPRSYTTTESAEECSTVTRPVCRPVPRNQCRDEQQQAMKDIESVPRDAAMQSATEFDKVASQVRAFRTQFEGLIGGDELAQVALEKFGPAMRAALTGSIPQIQAPSLVRAGSAEAYRMTIQPQIDQMQQQIDLQSQQLAEQQASNAILQEMSSNIANIQPAQRRR